jgi:hypothetical protein
MANVIDILVSKQAQAELDKVIASLKLTHEEIIKINQQGLKINSGASPKNPVQMNQSVKETIALTAQLTAEEQKLLVATNRLESLKQKQIQTQIKENALTKSTIDLKNKETLQRDRNEKALAKEQAKLEASLSLQARTNAQLKTVQNAYDNLAIKKVRYNNLTDNEEKRLVTLTNTLQKYRAVQDGVNTTVGKFQQRVGAYVQSGFNPLSNSINQLTREMPAFTYSVQTGFMAISNNLPIFFDAMGNVIRQNKELQAQGKPTSSALMQLASSFFSLQTLMGVGITLLTVYGKEIGEFLVGSESKKKAIEAEKKAIEEKQKAEDEAFKTTASYQSDELSKSKILFENAKNLSLSYKDRLKAVTELKNRYPEYLKHLSNEQILAGQTADAEERLNVALIGRGFALAAQQLLQSNIEKEIALRLKNATNEEKLLADQQEMFKKGANDIIVYTDRKKQAEQQKESFAKQARKAQSDAYKEQVRELRGEREAIVLQYNEYSKYLGVVNETTTAKKGLIVEEKELLKIGTEEWLNAQISALQESRSKLADNTEEYAIGTGAIKFYQQWLERLIGTQKKSNEETAKVPKYGTIEYYESLITELRKVQQTQSETNQEFAKIESQIKFYDELINKIKGVSEETEKATEKNTDYFDSFIDSFTSESGFSKTFDLIKDNFKLLKEGGATAALAISEAFQEAFNTIAQASQANFDAEYSRLEMQKNISIQFAGESGTAREEIERQYEERKKAIQRREAEAQKRLAIFNIITNTAQAVLATYAKVGFPAGIPLAIAMGAIGGAQIAMVSAQEIPQFWKGTENAPEGLAWTQEKGAEVITDKKGNVKTLGNNKGAQLTYLEKGDKVYKSHQDYINKTLVGAGIQPMRENNSLTSSDFNAGISKLAKTMQSNKGSDTQVFLNNKRIDTDYFKGKNV